MMVSIIAAMAENRVIGSAGAIPWHIPGDMRRFRELTWGHPVIMGRKTFESIGRPLPGRRNIVVTRQAGYRAEGCLVVHGLEEALDACKGEEPFICGGADIYRQAIARADRIYLTIVHGEYAGDAFFPEIPPVFVEKGRKELPGDPACAFLLLEKQ